MSKKVFLFEGTNSEKNETAEKTLSDVKDIEVERVVDYGLLEGRVELPFIETDEGDRYYGVRSIQKFASKLKG